MKRYSFDYRTRWKVFEKTGGFCFYCKGKLPDDEALMDWNDKPVVIIPQWDVDHVVPLSKGGTHDLGNLVPACKRCNRKKGNKLIAEMKI